MGWGLECTKSRIVLEGKEAVLISSLFKMFIMMLVEKLLGKIMNVWVWMYVVTPQQQ